jgi:hypothetical protein
MRAAIDVTDKATLTVLALDLLLGSSLDMTDRPGGARVRPES